MLHKTAKLIHQKDDLGFQKLYTLTHICKKNKYITANSFFKTRFLEALMTNFLGFRNGFPIDICKISVP